MSIVKIVVMQLNPEIVFIREDIAYDKNGNEVEYDLAAAEKKLLEMQAEEDVKKQTAEAKLAKLGLTPDDLRALLG